MYIECHSASNPPDFLQEPNPSPQDNASQKKFYQNYRMPQHMDGYQLTTDNNYQ